MILLNRLKCGLDLKVEVLAGNATHGHLRTQSLHTHKVRLAPKIRLSSHSIDFLAKTGLVFSAGLRLAVSGTIHSCILGLLHFFK